MEALQEVLLIALALSLMLGALVATWFAIYMFAWLALETLKEKRVDKRARRYGLKLRD